MNILQKNKIHLYPFILFIIVSLLLTIIWFHHGKILATGEVGIVFHNLQNQSSFFQYTWNESALGSPSAWGITSIPFYTVLKLMASAAPSYLFFSQATLFFIFVLSSLSGAYYYSKMILPPRTNSQHQLIPYFAAALFYITNLLVIANVLNRFQYTFIFFYMLTPWLLLLLHKIFISKIHYLSVALILLLSVFCYTYASIPLAIITWGVIFSYALFGYSQKTDIKNFLRVISLFTFMVVGWLTLNSWWILPLMNINSTTTYLSAEAYSSSGNIEAFVSNSNKHGNLLQLARLTNAEFFENMHAVWGSFYHNPLVIFLTYLPTMLILYVLFLPKKPVIIKFLLFMTGLTIFFSKGAAPPFGGISIFLVENIRILEALRNPFEKVGLLLPALFTPLIAYAFIVIKKPTLLLGICLTFILLGWPIWTGKVFAGPYLPQDRTGIGYKVEVPAYYDELNEFFNSQPEDFRVLVLPYNGEGITHTWAYGYSGVESYNGLFNRPMLSLSTNQEFLIPIMSQIEELLFSEKTQFSNMLSKLNIRYIILRSDVDIAFRNLTPPEKLKAQLSQLSTIKYLRSFGKLDLYRVEDTTFMPKIYASNSMNSYSTHNQSVYVNVAQNLHTDKSVVYVENKDLALVQDFTNKSLHLSEITEKTAYIKKDVLIPVNKYKVYRENVLAELPHTKYLPGDWQYPFMLLKENLLQTFNRSERDEVRDALYASSKRLSEIYKLSQQAKDYSTTSHKYRELINQISDPYIYQSSEAQHEFSKHQVLLQMINEQNSDAYLKSVLPEVQIRLDGIFKDGLKILRRDRVSYKYPIYRLNLPSNGQYNVNFSYLDTSTQQVQPFPLDADSDDDYVLINNIHRANYSHSSFVAELNSGTNELVFSDDIRNAIYQEPQISRQLSILEDFPIQQVKTLPEVIHRKISSVEYVVDVRNAQDPFILVFSEGFHPLWQATINGQKIPSRNHFLVNQFANAWKIDQKGDYQVTLYFAAEKSRHLGQRIATTALIILCAILVFYILRSTKKVRQ